jgi:hypothetical protein
MLARAFIYYCGRCDLKFGDNVDVEGDCGDY